MALPCCCSCFSASSSRCWLVDFKAKKDFHFLKFCSFCSSAFSYLPFLLIFRWATQFPVALRAAIAATSKMSNSAHTQTHTHTPASFRLWHRLPATESLYKYYMTLPPPHVTPPPFSTLRIAQQMLRLMKPKGCLSKILPTRLVN